MFCSFPSPLLPFWLKCDPLHCGIVTLGKIRAVPEERKRRYPRQVPGWRRGDVARRFSLDRSAPRCLSNLSHDVFFFDLVASPFVLTLSLSCARDASKFRTTQVANARPMVTSVSFVRDKRETERGRKHGEDRPRESKEEQALRGKKAAFDSRPKPLSLCPLFRCCCCCSPPACPASSSPLRCVSAPSAHAPAHPPLPRKMINERNPPSPATARLARRRARRRDWPLGRYQRRRLRAPRGQPGDQARDLAALPQRAPLGG